MNDIGTMVAELIQAGCAPEVAARVVAAAYVSGVESAAFRDMSRDKIVTSRDEELDRRRESDRIRKQRSRDRHALSRDNRDMSRDVTSASLSKEKEEEIKTEREAPCPERPRTTRGQRLADDWEPTGPDFAVATQLLTEAGAHAEVEKFRDHWKQQAGAKGVKLDWNAAWRNWTRRSAEYRGGRNGNGTGQTRTDTAAGRATSRELEIVASMARASSRVREDRAAAGQPGEVSQRPDAAAGTAPDGDRAWFDFQARVGTR